MFIPRPPSHEKQTKRRRVSSERKEGYLERMHLSEITRRRKPPTSRRSKRIPKTPGNMICVAIDWHGQIKRRVMK